MIDCGKPRGIAMIDACKAAFRPAACAAFCISLLLLGSAASAAETWKFYMHQSAPNFATSRGAKLLTENIDKATNGELKMQLHLSGTLQISASDITKAVGEGIVQFGDDLFNSGNIPVAGIPRLPGEVNFQHRQPSFVVSFAR